MPVFRSKNPNDKLFFWYFESKNKRSNDLVCWKNSGNDNFSEIINNLIPLFSFFSSVTSLLAEHGSFSGFYRETKKLTNNPHCWHQDSHIVYGKNILRKSNF